MQVIVPVDFCKKHHQQWQQNSSTPLFYNLSVKAACTKLWRKRINCTTTDWCSAQGAIAYSLYELTYLLKNWVIITVTFLLPAGDLLHQTR